MISGMLNGQAWTAGTFPLDGGVSARHEAASVISAAAPLWWMDADISTADDGSTLSDAPLRVGTTITQPTVSKRPLLDCDALNGLPAMIFDAVGDCLQVANDIGTDECSVFVTCYSDSAAGGPVFVEYSPSYFGTPGGVVVACDAQKPFIGTGETGVLTYRVSATTLDGVPAVLGGCFSRATDTDTCVMHVDGTLITSFSDQGNGNTAGNYPSETWSIGSRNNGASNPTDGAIREAVAYARELPAGQAVAIQCALRIRSKVL